MQARFGGESMISFSKGIAGLSYIEPDGVVKNGSYVFAVHEEEYIFRQLLIENEQYFLKPLNEKYPMIKIAGLDVIQGVITQRAGKRRKELKHYV